MRRGRSLIHAKGQAARGMSAGERRGRHGTSAGVHYGNRRKEEEEEREKTGGPAIRFLNISSFFCFFKTRSTLGILLRPLNYFRNYENI